MDGDNKLILNHFVEDLLTVLNMPAWPAADLVLQCMTNSLVTDYLNFKSGTGESTDKKTSDKYRGTALELLGKMASRCKEERLKNDNRQNNEEVEEPESENIFKEKNLKDRETAKLREVKSIYN